MNVRRLTASFAAALAIAGGAIAGTAVASADTDMTHGNKVTPVVHATPDTVCTPRLGMPHNQGLGQPCRHHHHHR